MKKNIVDNKIDIVLLWVDGNDEEWLKEKDKYMNIVGDSNVNRFRDCDNLQYIFRGFEKNMPWVNKIFFVTWGHIPKWLDTNNEKIIIVKHEEFIPKEYLPTFNSNVIELNIHRIKGLSDKFILFNDDFFILKPTKPEDFFIDNKPTDTYVETFLPGLSHNDVHFFMRMNILVLINKYFNKKDCIRKNLFKFLNFKYSAFFNFRTLYSMCFKEAFIEFWNFHAPYSYLKETFETVWEKEGELLNKVCKNKFRNSSDLGHYLCRYWQMVSGNFVPKKNESECIRYEENNLENIKKLKSGKYKFICISDDLLNIDFQKSKNEINKVLQELLPEKSSFEI